MKRWDQPEKYRVPLDGKGGKWVEKDGQNGLSGTVLREDEGGGFPGKAEEGERNRWGGRTGRVAAEGQGGRSCGCRGGEGAVGGTDVATIGLAASRGIEQDRARWEPQEKDNGAGGGTLRTLGVPFTNSKGGGRK